MNDKINNPKAIARQLKESLKEILQSSECFYSSIKDITFDREQDLKQKMNSLE